MGVFDLRIAILQTSIKSKFGKFRIYGIQKNGTHISDKEIYLCITQVFVERNKEKIFFLKFE